MSLLRSTTTALALFLISLYSFGQTSTGFDYSRHSFSESDVLKMLEDSSYLGLSYQQITSMETKEAIVFYKKNGYSMSQFIVAQSKARADIMDIRSELMKKEAEAIYVEIDKKLGIRK